MNRTLLIMRHGKSDWSAAAPTDFSRPLATRGKKAVPRMGRWLHHRGLQPDYVVCSPAIRARQTVLTLAPYLDFPETGVVWDERLYLADRATLLHVLAECPVDVGTVLLVGHNPGLEELLAYLSGAKCPVPVNGKLLPTAAVGILALSRGWRDLEQNAAVACEIKRPRDL